MLIGPARPPRTAWSPTIRSTAGIRAGPTRLAIGARGDRAALAIGLYACSRPADKNSRRPPGIGLSRGAGDPDGGRGAAGRVRRVTTSRATASAANLTVTVEGDATSAAAAKRSWPFMRRRSTRRAAGREPAPGPWDPGLPHRASGTSDSSDGLAMVVGTVDREGDDTVHGVGEPFARKPCRLATRPAPLARRWPSSPASGSFSAQQ